ncbi:hypothetical protein [Sorangium cellulosum]|uniref:hypothetical protein n=1 Tax=Sorangium cellulosum TaxID=56 RepID=UPI001F3FD9F1|nr:hypothetical protein [Sorangium cellulosum]
MLGLLAGGAALASGACSSSDAPRDECFGGVVVNGVCEGKCRPELCLAGNTCVGNRCVLECSSHLECTPGLQDCVPAVEDDTEAKVSVCRPNGKMVGFGAPCPFGFECGHFGRCPDDTPCNPMQCNGNPGECQRDAAACGDDAACTAGKCGDGSYCFIPTCAPDQCSSLGLECLGKGEGDAEAYCTQPHCEGDADCPGGFECALTRDPHAICGTDKGNSSFCGETDEECIDPSTFGEGNTYEEGSLCLLRKTCVKRTQCAPCSSDVDCSLVLGQRCVTIGGESRCARSCSEDSDCDLDYRCDGDVCKPRFDRCVGDPGGFCHPCRNDTDCGDADSTMECTTTLRGQRACLDAALPIRCTEENAAEVCPKSPSGLAGACVCVETNGSRECVDSRCYLPSRRLDPSDPQSVVTSCW